MKRGDKYRYGMKTNGDFRRIPVYMPGQDTYMHGITNEIY